MRIHYTLTLRFEEANGDIIETHKTFCMDPDMLNQFKPPKDKDGKYEDGATVRVQIEISDKKFGAGVSVSGAVTLTVAQDDTMIETAFNYGAALLSDKVKEVIPDVNDIYEALRRR